LFPPTADHLVVVSKEDRKELLSIVVEAFLILLANIAAGEISFLALNSFFVTFFFFF